MDRWRDDRCRKAQKGGELLERWRRGGSHIAGGGWLFLLLTACLSSPSCSLFPHLSHPLSFLCLLPPPPSSSSFCHKNTHGHTRTHSLPSGKEMQHSASSLLPQLIAYMLYSSLFLFEFMSFALIDGSLSVHWTNGVLLTQKSFCVTHLDIYKYDIS